MKFIVQFESGENTSPIKMEFRCGGLDLLDRAREFAGIPDLSPEFVDDFIGPVREFVVESEVSESVARKTRGLFATTSTATVTVPPHSLEGYVGEEPYLDQQGERMIVRWRPVIRASDIVKDWVRAGCPAEWNPNVED